jgi:nucleotide-binding universal stress UspA family protein
MNVADSSQGQDSPDIGTPPRLIAVGIDGGPESRDAAFLAASIAAVSNAEVLMVAVHPGSPTVLPHEMDSVGLHEQAAKMMHELRDSVLPNAGAIVETDQSVAHALERVARAEHRDLLVLGSSDRGPLGCVRLGTGGRQLLDYARCALAVAPRGLSARPPQKLRLIGVGYGGEAGGREALNAATALSRAAGAELHVRRVDDERSGADALLRLSAEVDLLVIGSRGSGPAGRVLPGSIAERLLQNARCPLMVIPRPAR